MKRPGDLVRINDSVLDGAFSFGRGTGVRVRDVPRLPGRLGVVVERDPKPASPRGETWYGVWLAGYEAKDAVLFSAHELSPVSR